MSKHIKLFVVALAAMGAFLIGTTSASASRGASISPGGGIAATSVGRLTLSGGGLNIECNVTLNGSLVRSAAKVVGTSVGTLSSGTAINCNSNATVVILFPAAWNLTYAGFTGTLPNITGINFVVNNAQFLLNIPGIGACLFAGNVPATLNRNTSTGAASTITVGTNSVPISRTLSGICPTAGSLRGSFSIPTQTVTLI